MPPDSIRERRLRTNEQLLRSLTYLYSIVKMHEDKPTPLAAAQKIDEVYRRLVEQLKSRS